MRKLTTEEFIEKAKAKHGDKYYYSKVDYVDSKTKVIIICKEHGEFKQKPRNHLHGQGCSECVGNKKSNTEKFIKDAKKIHGDKFNYSKVEYTNNITEIIIICPKHGKFPRTPNSHLAGHGCPKCAGLNKTTEEFINFLKENHEVFSFVDEFQTKINFFG